MNLVQQALLQTGSDTPRICRQVMECFILLSNRMSWIKCLDRHDHGDSATAPICEWVAQTPQLGLTKSATFFEVSFLLKLPHMCLLSQLALPSGLTSWVGSYRAFGQL